jgi:pilus assembly protein Flp/PilA
LPKGLKPTAGASDVGRVKKLESIWIRLRLRLTIERGQTMAEYGILIAVIAVVVVVAALTLGGSITALFSGSSAKL